MTPDLPPDAVAFFDGSPQGLAICNAVFNAISDLGPISVRVSKSQIAIRRRHGFAFLWRPGRYVKSTAPVVLSLALPHELGSRRFKQVAHPAPSVWMHHLEIRDPVMVDEEVEHWLREAFDAA